MSNSFKLTNGDLTLGPGRSYERVSGANKLAQDLRLWILERIGTDPSTPTFGSRLDGGVIDGEEVPSFIGTPGSPMLLAEIRSEVSSLLSRYQQAQIAKMQKDMLLNNGVSTLDKDEILHTINSVEAAQELTTVVVRATVTSLAGTSLQLIIPTEV